MWFSESGRKEPKELWWNDVVKDASEGKEAAWKGVLGDMDEDTKDRCMELYKGEKCKTKRRIY